MFEMPTPPVGREEGCIVNIVQRVGFDQLQSSVEDCTKRDSADEDHESQYEDDKRGTL